MKKSIFNILLNAFTITTILAMVLLTSCDDEDPKKEDVPELITSATLAFTPTDGGSAVVVTATDPDGQGTQNIAPSGPIILQKEKSYTLSITLINELASSSDPEYNITEEVEEEGDEHIFFFAWTNNTFSDPAGNGNIDNRSDAVNYSGAANSVDAQNLPLGLTTTWTTPGAPASGTFRVLLKHQPGLKSETSDANTGETDLDLTFNIEIR